MGAPWRCRARNIESVALERGLGKHVLIAGSAFSLEKPNNGGGPMPEVVELHWDKQRISRGAIVLLTIGAPGLFLATTEGVDAKSLGLAWALAFVALAAAVYGRSFNIEPVITISTHGVHDRRISAEPIPWVSDRAR
jgi:hypothetical protein